MNSLLSWSISAVVAGVAGLGLSYQWRSWRHSGEAEQMAVDEIEQLRQEVRRLPFCLKKGPKAAELRAIDDPRYARWMQRYTMALSLTCFGIAVVLLLVWLSS